MAAAFPEALVDPPPERELGLGRDPGDRHVLAAAAEPFGIEVLTPDQFLYDLIDLGPAAIHGCLEAMAAPQRNPSRPVRALLQILGREASNVASLFREFLSSSSAFPSPGQPPSA